MNKRMLIDAAHREETRVALVTDGRVEDFDFEPEGNKQLRGNIYLAKITRVEPSLQAAFVEYGGNRHGFLAFSEIHPDYYQLPQEDREALLREAAEEAAAEEAEDIDPDEIDDSVDAPFDDDDDASDEDASDAKASDDDASEDDTDAENDAEDDEDDSDDGENEGGDDAEPSEKKPEAKAEKTQRPRRRRRTPQRRYKIQEVVRRRQVMLVQVVKEERGNKGAALTTYLSLAGRYSVLMPNTPRGGGISRKIANGADRKRLKTIVNDLEVPDGMGLIVRTAGAKRTKAEIKRDYDYLSKLWNNICEATVSSMAPCLINEEGDLVHRAMRDLYDKDVEEVLIQGEKAYNEAKDLAKLLMPSHVKKVKLWEEDGPLFVEMGVEEQLDQIFSPTVQMKSGGYLVINQTEALVAIDVNSGKSTRERNIEQTATRTNLEAAEEACRQMRLRDLAGLVVIDFIDMDENKNNRAVEKKMKDCLNLDRARVQHGRISQFGLMELSRQRRRAGILQSTSAPCPTCDGTGRQRSIKSAALQLLRAIEARVANKALLSLSVTAPTDVALYLLNNKRDALSSIEEMSGATLSITSSAEMLPGEFKLDAQKNPNARRPARRASSDEKERKPRRTRGGRGRGRTKTDDEDTSSELDVIETEDEDSEAAPKPADGEATEDAPRKRRKRGRRGGRKRRRNTETTEAEAGETKDGTDASDEAAAPATETSGDEAEPAKKPARRSRRKKAEAPEDGGAYLDGLSVTAAAMLDGDGEKAETPAEDEKPKPRRRRAAKPKVEAKPEETAIEAEEKPAKPKPRRRAAKPKAAKPEAEAPVETKSDTEDKPDDAPKRRGWWSRKKAG